MNKPIKISKNNIIEISFDLNGLIYYKWEDLLVKIKLFYIKIILQIVYQYMKKSLNLNIKYYIQNNIKNLNHEIISVLMSKNKYNY